MLGSEAMHTQPRIPVYFRFQKMKIRVFWNITIQSHWILISVFENCLVCYNITSHLRKVIASWRYNKINGSVSIRFGRVDWVDCTIKALLLDFAVSVTFPKTYPNENRSPCLWCLPHTGPYDFSMKSVRSFSFKLCLKIYVVCDLSTTLSNTMAHDCKLVLTSYFLCPCLTTLFFCHYL